MLAGEELYKAFARTHRLFDGEVDVGNGALVFETFPQAAVCSLMGEVVSAKNKRQVRRSVLWAHGIAVQELTNIDFIDAAVCALTANCVAAGTWRCYGEDESGFIVVPRASE